MYHTIVVRHDYLEPKFFIPKRAKKNSSGQYFKSKFEDKFIEEDCPPRDIYKQPIIGWRTRKPDLDGCPPDKKRIINAVKSWLSDSDCALWYHNGNCDSLSLFGGRHLHVVVKTDTNIDGTPRVLHNNAKYRTMRKVLADTSGSVRSQIVRRLPNLCAHLCTPPRHYMGSRNKELGRILSELHGNPPEPIQYSDCVEDEPESEDNWNEPVKDKGTEWDFDPAPAEFIQPSRASDPWAEEDDQWGGTSKDNAWGSSFNVPKGTTAGQSELMLMNTKRTARDGKVTVMTWLCRQFDKYSLEELRLAISKLDDDNHIKMRWETLQHHQGLAQIVDSVSRAERVKYNSFSFMDLCKHFMSNPLVIDPGYMKLENSLKLWLKWCQAQQIDAGQMLWEIAIVLDKRLPKRNTLCFVGASNAGKTIVMSKPLRTLVKFPALIGNVQSTGQFTWQDCSNVRAIFIDEGMFAPEQLEKFKSIAGGDETTVDVKHQSCVVIPRTPVIVTSNYDPWRMQMNERTALMNRMFYHNVRSQEFLKNCQKDFNPAIFYFMMKHAAKTWGDEIPTTYVDPELDLNTMLSEIEQWQYESSSMPDDDESDDDCIIDPPPKKIRIEELNVSYD